MYDDDKLRNFCGRLLQYDSLSMLKYIDKNMGEKLGNGGCGQVYQTTLKAKNSGTVKWPEMTLAAKVMVASEELQHMFMREWETQRKVHHPAIMPLLASRITNNGYVIYMFLGRCSLTHMLREAEAGRCTEFHDPDFGTRMWDSTSKAIAIYGIASGIAKLHRENIIHRDLKPDNIIMDSDMYPHISDFGLAREIPDANTADKADKMTMGIGTWAYQAPELFDGSTTYSFPVDVFAFSVIVWEILEEKHPWWQNGFTAEQYAYYIHTHVARGDRLPIPDSDPYGYLWEMVTRAWSHHPEDRPTMEKIVDYLDDDQFMECFPDMDIDRFCDYREWLKSCD